MGLPFLQKDPPFFRLDRLLFYGSAAVLLLALAVFFWQSCRGIPIPGERNRVLVFTQWWQDEWDAGVLPARIREFEAQNPGIRIDLDTRPYHEVRSLLLSAVPPPAGGKPDGAAAAAVKLPDIIGLDPRWFPALSGIGGELFEDGPDIPEKGVPFRAAGGEAHEALPGAWPVVFCVFPLFYRTDLLRETGFDRPPKDQAEFTAAALGVTDSEAGRYGFALSLSPADPLGVYRDVFSWFRSSGAAFLRNGQPAFTETPAVNTLRFLNGLAQEGILAPDTFTKTNKDRVKDFIAGRLAMMVAPAAEISGLRAAGIPFGVTTIPGHASYAGKSAAGMIGWYAGIPRSGRHKDEARSFLSFLAEKAGGDAGGDAGGVTGGNPVREADELYRKISDIYTAAGTTEEYLSLPEELMLETILGEELPLMFEQGRTPEETARAVQQRWEAAL